MSVDEVTTTRARILYTAAKLTGGERNKSYGHPVGNMTDIARMWNTYMTCRGIKIEGYLDSEDVAHMMTLMKIARTVNHSVPVHADNYIDAAAYQGIAGECAEHTSGRDE
jgi:hypothetical protein